MPAPTPQEIEAAVEELRRGRVVAFPTETVYGLGADAANAAAVEQVFALKDRPRNHPLIVHVAGRQAVTEWTRDVGPFAWQLADRFWPGPLTLVLPAASHVLRCVTGGQDSIAIRVPDHPVALQLLRQFGKGVAAPSANRFGRVSPTTADHVRSEFPDAELMILDGGPCRVGIESTIVDCRGEVLRILRPGAITAADILAAIGVLPLKADPDGPRVSGSLAAHYAPRAEVIVAGDQQLSSILKSRASGRTLLCLPQPIAGPLAENVSVRPVPEDPRRLAPMLYGLLRAADEEGFARIVFMTPPEHGVGVAIGDRLQRAARGSRRSRNPD